MRSTRNYPAMEFKVGTLLAVALSLTLLGLIFPTKGVNPFSRKFTLVAYFPTVAGLKASSPVWFSGIEVGSVRSVDFVPGSVPPKLKVVLTVERKVMHYIRTDSKASIQGMGLLGDMYVDITPGSGDPVHSGDEIAGVPPEDFKEALQSVWAEVQGTLRNLESITGQMASGQGTIGRLLQDPDLYPRLSRAVAELAEVAQRLNDSQGTVGKLLDDPALYDELVKTVQEARAVVADLKHAEEKVLSPQTKETLDDTIKTVSRVVKRVGEYQEKIDRIRFDLNFGASKHSGSVASGHAHLDIWPNDQRYYSVGLQKITDLYGQETEKTTFDAQLAWRIFQSPFFVRGGLIRDEFFVAGVDLRVPFQDLKLAVDAYRLELSPIQLDVRTGITVLDVLELTAGAENVLRTPFYKAGLTLHYKDDDLLTVLMKSLF